jgi:putative endonuclease
MKTIKRVKGDLGEKKAEKFLRERGFRIVEKNYQNKFGEIDIICKRGNCLHFVEVKTSFTAFNPEENMTQNKMRKILRTANMYLFNKNLNDLSIFFDLVSVNFNKRVVRMYPNINNDILD